ncbi:MAG TPA: metallophosphoesterase family protein [Candidatus Atribacteria bacterium]|nr:metallophosphoesterase family protein [Candidatus Atribacteria bacterium]HPU08151.1 metallophosphoesterase family protein [Candidatus Atribacteria bacterium]
MKVAVISDTHIPQRGNNLPDPLLYFLRGVSLILHAGDITEWWVLEELMKYAPVRAVRGNMDSPSVKEKLSDSEIVEIEGVKIGLTHGGGPPAGIEERVGKLFAGEKLQAIVYGHTHQPNKEWREGVLYFNPGSPTDWVFAPYFSFGFLEVEEGKIIEAEIVRIN